MEWLISVFQVPPITFLYSHNYLFISTLFSLFSLIYYQIFDEMA